VSQSLAPEDVRTLDAQFDVVLDLTDQQQAAVQILICAPRPDYKLVERLRSGGEWFTTKNTKAIAGDSYTRRRRIDVRLQGRPAGA
jgi:hypothetical protein